jgi:DNA adenine methylase
LAIKPLFRWAGGKGKMLKHYVPLLPDLTTSSNYCEPFFGGGAMFIHIRERYPHLKCYIGDINEDIANVYKCIRDDVQSFLKRLQELDKQYIPLSKEERKKYYYDLRNAHAYEYKNWTPVIESATLYFLMKTSFNGIFQINKNTNNRFGTPSGLLNEKQSAYDLENVLAWNKMLQGVTIIGGKDWSESVKQLDAKDTFYFFDPPYRESHTSYGQIFGDDKQEELLEFCKSVDNTCKIMLCNRDDNDNFWEGKEGSLFVARFPITYTAGRRKKNGNTFLAKKATEILFYSEKMED